MSLDDSKLNEHKWTKTKRIEMDNDDHGIIYRIKVKLYYIHILNIFTYQTGFKFCALDKF